MGAIVNIANLTASKITPETSLLGAYLTGLIEEVRPNIIVSSAIPWAGVCPGLQRKQEARPAFIGLCVPTADAM